MNAEKNRISLDQPTGLVSIMVFRSPPINYIMSKILTMSTSSSILSLFFVHRLLFNVCPLRALASRRGRPHIST